MGGIIMKNYHNMNLFHNPSLGLVTNVRACKGAGQEGSPGVTSHVPGSVGECEGMNSQVNSHFGSWGPNGLPNFQRVISGVKTHWIEEFLISMESPWNALGTKMSKMGLHDPFEHFKHKLWPKEGPKVKLAIWLPTIKSQESPQFPCVQVTCHIPLESSWQGIQLCFRLHLNRRSSHKVMGPQNCGSANFENFGTPTWESRNKMTFEC
jgi:hypothetical protein